jgi:hypothetical protein
MTTKTAWIRNTALVLVPAVLLMSCATIIGKSSPETLNVRSTPDQACVVITDETGVKIYEGKTPTILTLEKKKGYFSGKSYKVTVTKEGFRDRRFTVDTEIGGWYLAGNLLFGGLIGWLIVDPATGAMWTLSKNEIDAALESVPAAQDQQAAPAPQAPAPPAEQLPASPTEQSPASPTEQSPASPQTRIQQSDTAVIVLLQDVPDSLRDKMIRVP